MALTIDDVITPATEDDFFAEILSIATALGLKTTSWQSGGITRTILRIVSKLEASRDQIISLVAAGGFLKLAAAVTNDPSVKNADGTYPTFPGWLDICADSGFDVQRNGATYANGPMVITNASAATYGPFAPGTYHLANPTTKKGYHNTASLTIGPSGNTTATFEADEAGADSTSSASSITQTVTSLVGVSINPGSQSGSLIGTNAESNDALIARCLNKLAALGPKLGPGGAYEYFATTTSEPGYPLPSSPITRVAVSADPASGVVIVTIANASGAPSGPDVAAMDTYLKNNCVPDSVTEETVAANNQSITPAIDVWVPVGYQTTAFADKIRASVTAFIDGLPIGGIVVDTLGTKGVPLNAVEDAVFNTGATSPTKTVVTQAKVTLNGFAADVSLLTSDVAKTVAYGSITVTFH